MIEVCVLCARHLEGATLETLPICLGCQEALKAFTVDQRLAVGKAINEHLARRCSDRQKAEVLKQLERILSGIQKRMDDDDPFQLFHRN